MWEAASVLTAGGPKPDDQEQWWIWRACTPLGHRVAQQHDVLVKRFNLTLEFDAVDRKWTPAHVHAELVQKMILQELAFLLLTICSVFKELREGEHTTAGKKKSGCTFNRIFVGAGCFHFNAQGCAD